MEGRQGAGLTEADTERRAGRGGQQWDHRRFRQPRSPETLGQPPSLSARQEPGVGRELGQGDRAAPEGLAPFLPLRLVPRRRLLGR